MTMIHQTKPDKKNHLSDLSDL